MKRTNKQESERFSNQYELLKNLQPLALADYAACYSRLMNDFDGNISYICRSTEVNVIFMLA